MKAGDLIYWHWSNTIALVISVHCETDIQHAEDVWVCLWDCTHGITHDDLAGGYTIIDENWDWPEWHINSRR